jgi:hypothetical protein
MLEVEFVPDDLGLDTGPLPRPIDFFVVCGHGAVAVPFDCHFLPLHVLEPLVGSTGLVVRNDLHVVNLFPLGGTNQMLRSNQLIAEEQRVTATHQDQLMPPQALEWHGNASPHHLNVLLGRQVSEVGIIHFVVLDLATHSQCAIPYRRLLSILTLNFGATISSNPYQFVVTSAEFFW